VTLYSTILCAIDFSDHSRRALRLALAIATRQRARVVAVHAVDPLLAEAAATLSGGQSLEPDALSELNDLIAAERTGMASAPAVTTIVRVGPPAEVILDVAQENGAGLIAMGTQGLGGLRKLFFGSIAERVLRDAHVPAVAVPLPDAGDAAGVPRIREVIAAVEMDHTAEAIAEHAATVAESLGLPLVLLHVVAPVHGAPRTAEAAAEATRLHEAGAQARLAELAARAGAVTPGRPVAVEVRSGPAAEEIAAAAAARQALVTIASGGNDEHHRPGSIAYRVLCLCDLPVLAVPTRHDARG
jgi:nucleotide-binding universal stress UspA family protein